MSVSGSLAGGSRGDEKNRRRRKVRSWAELVFSEEKAGTMMHNATGNGRELATHSSFAIVQYKRQAAHRQQREKGATKRASRNPIRQSRRGNTRAVARCVGRNASGHERNTTTALLEIPYGITTGGGRTTEDFKVKDKTRPRHDQDKDQPPRGVVRVVQTKPYADRSNEAGRKENYKVI